VVRDNLSCYFKKMAEPMQFEMPFPPSAGFSPKDLRFGRACVGNANLLKTKFLAPQLWMLSANDWWLGPSITSI